LILSLIKKKRIVLFLAGLAGMSGTVLFFPVQLDGSYTCFYHRIIEKQHPVGTHKYNDTDRNKMHSKQVFDEQEQHVHDNAFLKRYITRYAGLWWGSIGLLILSYYGWKRSRKQVNRQGMTW
jgi:hypothetical protein